MNLLPKIFAPSDKQQRDKLEHELMRREAVIGGKLFGSVPAGGRREFFCLDDHTWVWYEERIVNGQKQVITTRYNVRPDGILKQQNGQGYQWLSREETHNLRQAAELYLRRITDYYRGLRAI